MATGTEIYEADNIQLSFNTVTSAYNFMSINKDSLLQYTDSHNCVATPLVWSAGRQINIKRDVRMFRPIFNNVM
jgi:hypothetical protein